MKIIIRIWAIAIFVVLSPIVIPILFCRAVIKHCKKRKGIKMVWEAFKGYRKKGG